MSEQPATHEVLPLIEALLDGTIDDHGFSRLESMLLDDTEARAIYVSYMNLHAALPGVVGEPPRLSVSIAYDNISTLVEPHEMPHGQLLSLLAQIEAKGEDLDPMGLAAQRFVSEQPVVQTTQDVFAASRYLFDRCLSRHVAASIVIAAVVLMAVTLLVVLLPAKNTPEHLVEVPDIVAPAPHANRVVATITEQHGATWLTDNGEGSLPDHSLLGPNQRLTLTQGFAQITTTRGAKALIQAPATIETTDSDNAIRLHEGRMVGICETESSQGLQVHTPHVTVTDLSTRFGVDATRQESTECLVFEGRVRLSANHLGAGLDREIIGGEAISISSRDDIEVASIREIAPDHLFALSWQDALTHVEITGQARLFKTPPADITPNALIDPDHLILFQEKTAVTDRPLRVMRELSSNAGRNDLTTVPKGTRVMSYMVHFSPAYYSFDGGNAIQNISSASARIKFPGRVLGLINGGKPLTDTDELLGLDTVAYFDSSNSIYNNAIDGWPSDSIRITGENQDVLEIKLGALIHSDQARILVEVPIVTPNQ